VKIAPEPAVYAQCGLRLRSDRPLDLPVVADRSWDVDVVWGAEVEGTSEDPPGELIAERQSYEGGEWWYRFTETGDGFLLRFRGIGDVHVSRDLSRVEVNPDGAGTRDVLPVVLSGGVAAFLLSMRGATVLHASAVSVDGTALAFVAPSGSGKTTLATLLCLHGSSLIADDVLVVDPGPPPTCEGGVPELRLREGAARMAQGREGALERRTSDDRLGLTLGPALTGAVPLGAIVLPFPSRDVLQLDVRRMSAVDALLRLLAQSRVDNWTRADVIARDFDRLSELSNRVPLYAAAVPWGLPFQPATAEGLMALASSSAPERTPSTEPDLDAQQPPTH
jgi:hypothetical protein